MPKLILGYQGYPSKGLTKSQDDNKHAEEFFLLKVIYSKLVLRLMLSIEVFILDQFYSQIGLKIVSFFYRITVVVKYIQVRK